ncbi:hypothetical protein N9B72_01680 [Bacteriovoracaceae bacterium]|nr:hypothetical protein [Bacteriovoracaceae bacterium]
MLTKVIFSTLMSMTFLVPSAFSEVAKSQSEKTQLEKEVGAVNFDSLKNVLKNDMLIPIVEGKNTIVKKIKEKRVIDNTQKFNYPNKTDFWKILTQVWLVKNATLLKWDIAKPNYGIESNFRRLLETIGHYEKTFHILLTKNPEITHMGLPFAKNEYMLIISIPFIRSMDLSKLEISLLLLEDVFRIEAGHLKSNIKMDTSWLGTNFKKSGYESKYLIDSLKKMSDAVLKKGFSFQQQFETTKRMDSILKSHPSIWNAYLKLLRKTDDLVKSNVLFKSYLRIYPSPEMQIKWIVPGKKW